AARDLFHGVGGPDVVPDPGDRYQFFSRDVNGASPGLEVKDSRGRKWSVRLGPEAQTEIAVSRLVWAVGYHQPPTYLVRDWALTGGPDAGPQGTGRFRPELPGTKETG